MSWQAPDLSVIVLIWNSERFIARCLDSLHRAMKNVPHEVIVVDNGSCDRGPELVAALAPNAQIIRNTKNRGVAAGRNQGLAAARGRYLWLLDVDTCFQAGSVSSLLTFMDKHPSVGLLGCQLLYPDGELQHSARRFPTVLSKLLRRLPCLRFLAGSPGEYYQLEGTTSPREVDYVIGACQVIRRAAFETVGYLDSRIFYGPEDVDYCLRLWQAGWSVVYHPGITLLHDEQRITSLRFGSLITWKHAAALVYYFHKHRYWLSREKLYPLLPVHHRSPTGQPLSH